MMRIYVSHGVTEEPTGVMLADTLTRSGFEVRDRRTVPLSSPDALDLERQILACDYVVLLLSPRTTADGVVTPAVEVALRHGFGNGRLLAMRLPNRVDPELAAQRLVAEVQDRAAQPPPRSRLPIVARTLRELEGLESARGVPERTLHDILEVLEAAEAHHRTQSIEEAAAALATAAARLDAALPSFRPYYVAIARAICCLQRSLDSDAALHLRTLHDHPLRDESWYAAMAISAMRAGRDVEARLHLRNAMAECRLRGSAGLEVLADLCPSPVAGAPGHDPAESRYARAARGLLVGRPELALLLLQGLPISSHDERSILLLSRAYVLLESWGAAAACLEMYAAAIAPAPVGRAIAEQLARCYTAVGAHERAAEVLEQYGARAS